MIRSYIQLLQTRDWCFMSFGLAVDSMIVHGRSLWKRYKSLLPTDRQKQSFQPRTLLTTVHFLLNQQNCYHRRQPLSPYDVRSKIVD